MTESAYPNQGRRKRLRKRLIESQLGKLYDYEILELFLYLSIPRKDTKPLAKQLLKKFGSIGKLINADAPDIRNVDGVGESTIANLYLLKEITFRANKEAILSKPIISSKNDLINYLRSSIGNGSIERVHILYLNNKNRLIGDEILDYGTTNRVAIYPREIVKKAIFLNASAVILAHNHPSGNTKPSQSDIDQTNELQLALEAVDVVLHDHVIISSNSYFSFKTNDLLFNSRKAL